MHLFDNRANRSRIVRPEFPQKSIRITPRHALARQHLTREIARIEGDDGIGAACNGNGQDVNVVFIGQMQPCLKPRLGGDVGLWKFSDQLDHFGACNALGLGSDFAGRARPFLKNTTRPERCVKPRLCDADLYLSQHCGIENAGIQNSLHPSSRKNSAFRYADSASCGSIG